MKIANTDPEVDDIKQDIKSLKNHAGELTEHVKADGREKVEEMTNRAHEQLHHLKDAGREKIRTMESYVQENPVQSIVYAFLGGLAASLLLGRR